MKIIYGASLVTFTVKPCEIKDETETHYIPVRGMKFLKKSPVSSYFNTQVQAYGFLLSNRLTLRNTRLNQLAEIDETINRLQEEQYNALTKPQFND